MRHRIAGRTLNRTSAHRKALRRNLAIALFQHGAIRTTEPKAKDIRPYVEKLISMARRDCVHARRLVSAELGNRRGMRGDLFDSKTLERQEQGVLDKLFVEIAPRYVDRPGGYTRIIRLGERRLGDAGRQVILQLVETGKAEPGEQAPGGVSRRARRADRRRQAAESAQASAAETPAPEAPAAEAPGEEVRDK